MSPAEQEAKARALAPFRGRVVRVFAGRYRGSIGECVWFGSARARIGVRRANDVIWLPAKCAEALVPYAD